MANPRPQDLPRPNRNFFVSKTRTSESTVPCSLPIQNEALRSSIRDDAASGLDSAVPKSHAMVFRLPSPDEMVIEAMEMLAEALAATATATSLILRRVGFRFCTLGF